MSNSQSPGDRAPFGHATTVLARWPSCLGNGLSGEVQYLVGNLHQKTDKLINQTYAHPSDPTKVAAAARNIPLNSLIMFRRLAPQDMPSFDGIMLLTSHLGQLDSKQRGTLQDPSFKDSIKWRGSQTFGQSNQVGRLFVGPELPPWVTASTDGFFKEHDTCGFQSQRPDESVSFKYTGKPIPSAQASAAGTISAPFMLEPELADHAINLCLGAPESAKDFTEVCVGNINKATNGLDNLIYHPDGTPVDDLDLRESSRSTEIQKNLIAIAWCSHELAKSGPDYANDTLRNELFLDTILEAYKSQDDETYKSLMATLRADSWIWQGRSQQSSRGDSGVFTVRDPSGNTQCSADNTFTISNEATLTEVNCAFGSRLSKPK